MDAKKIPLRFNQILISMLALLLITFFKVANAYSIWPKIIVNTCLKMIFLKTITPMVFKDKNL